MFLIEVFGDSSTKSSTTFVLYGRVLSLADLNAFLGLAEEVFFMGESFGWGELLTGYEQRLIRSMPKAVGTRHGFSCFNDGEASGV